MVERLRVRAATANPGKLAELQVLLGDHLDFGPRPDIPDVAEDAETLVGNARLKAVAIVDETGEPALSDDTGLEVDALGGAPGVWSARFAGPDASADDNVDKLLADLSDHSDRGAQFRTVLMLLWPDGRELVAEGVVRGQITEARSGGGGFGYDPVFAPEGHGGVTFAEMSAEDKNAISHRGVALRKLLGLLNESS